MKNSYCKILCFVFVLFIFNSSFLIPNCFSQWVHMSNGMCNATASALAANGNYVFAGTMSGPSGCGVYLSTNNGTSWTQTSLNGGYVSALAVNGNNVFAGIWAEISLGVYKSTNNGTSWTYAGLMSQGIWSLAVNGDTVFAGTGSYGVYLSTNNGISWTQTSLNGGDVSALAINGNNVFAGTYSGLYLSTNNGTSWTYAGLSQTIRSLAINGNNIFAGTQNWSNPNGVYLSTNNGTSWTQTSLNNQIVWSLAINGNNVFAGTYQYGVYVSTNNGTSWIQRNEGLAGYALHINAFCILNNYIFAGTDSSVYRRPLSELVGIQPISNEVPQSFSLSQNYPNPFNPSTIIKFDLPSVGNGHDRFIKLKIYDILGKEVATLVNESLKPGSYEIKFDASGYSSGIYFYKLSAADFIETKKMMLIK
jgi:Secretion system C-terminal sorting domain